MNTKPRSDSTIDYYNANAEAFVAATRDVDMTAAYESFLGLLPGGAHILDAGAGSGRDTRAFLSKGYQVTAFDGSVEMARRASEWTGIEVLHRTFQDISWRECFDGVWACASLLHLPEPDLRAALGQLADSLRPQGVIYMSFKKGTTHEVRAGRFFADFSESSLGELVACVPQLRLHSTWETADRAGRSATTWINALCLKA